MARQTFLPLNCHPAASCSAKKERALASMDCIVYCLACCMENGGAAAVGYKDVVLGGKSDSESKVGPPPSCQKRGFGPIIRQRER